jgi:hypothetical protein
MVPVVELYSSSVPPRLVLHPVMIADAHTIDSNNAIFMEQRRGEWPLRQWSETRNARVLICVLRSQGVCFMLPAWTRQQLRLWW